ncbi:uncharacterized protein B0H18DRAFT_190681 [Fomitopsis serialis]|uniref:uncharacterized protein n=1 Tax=Fomitopsis serialis TaxID=139415 RepID=UPI00200754FD|nr:uncharacterized protein B0H18DRAFT_190681 [Neoantrodia serialis]KAH9937213.1 hypothetical protein B0H18DRAFT_190681 [Neoantrodia serialis]
MPITPRYKTKPLRSPSYSTPSTISPPACFDRGTAYRLIGTSLSTSLHTLHPLPVFDHCYTLMPSSTSSHQIDLYRSARDLPQEFGLRSTITLGTQTLCCPTRRRHDTTRSLWFAGSNIWLVCSTLGPSSFTASVDFVLSCTEGPLGSYPLFIYTPIPFTQLDPRHYIPRLRSLVHSLQQAVPSERVFSIFALEDIARAFASLWTKATGVKLERDPEYYAAKLTYCTRATLQAGQLAPLRDVSYDLRPARESDLLHVAELCCGFAVTSEPFTLSMSRAAMEAKLLIQNGQVWVHEICARGQRPEMRP